MSNEEVKREYRAQCSKCASAYEFLNAEFLHSIQGVKWKIFCKQCINFEELATQSLWCGFGGVLLRLFERGRIKQQWAQSRILGLLLTLYMDLTTLGFCYKSSITVHIIDYFGHQD